MTEMTMQAIDPEKISATQRTIRPHIRRTPVVEADGADFGLAPGRLALKLELLQHAGSFKTRGAFANLLTRRVPQAGVIAASGGNHGAAVAYAAMKLGVHAKIFVPGIASPAKIDRIRGYGADLVASRPWRRCCPAATSPSRASVSRSSSAAATPPPSISSVEPQTMCRPRSRRSSASVTARH